MNSKAKKIAATATALALSASLLLGGTYAWQSVNQVALNEASDVVNPGGRLHDDFNGESKDVYVENFATEDIFARIRFDEYMEVVMNYDPNNPDAAQTKTDVITVGATKENPETYLTRKFGEDGINATDAFWNWTMGSADSEQVYYMPTFNVNKDSLRADVNGVFDGANFTITDRDGTQYDDFVKYNADSEKPGYEIYDADSNDADELAGLSDDDFKDVIVNGTYDGSDVVLVQETHKAQLVGDTNGLISMADWLALGEYSEATHGNYWVYDTDGWVYWSSPIKGGEATGLLLDGISLKGVMDDTWYYAINVVAQFVTADDVGKADGTGFYDTTKSATVPTTEAEALLKAIGVQFPEDAGTGGEDNTDTTAPTIALSEEGIQAGEKVVVTISDLSDSDFPLTLSAYAYTEENVISDTAHSTFEITYNEGIVSSVNDNINVISYQDGILLFEYDAVSDGLNPYYDYGNGVSNEYGLKMTVTDIAGNGADASRIYDTSGCFAAGTLVQTANGPVNIEEIQVGDKVYSIDLSTGEKVLSTVSWVQETRYIDATYTIYAGSEEIVTTYEHPFYVAGKQWVAAEDLELGDKLIAMDGNEIEISNIVYTELDEPMQVYNFTVDTSHNYLIGESGILVHNITK